MYACACGIKIPPAGSFGPILGAGALATDTRLGSPTGGSAAAGGINYLDWHKHPIVWLLVLVFVILLARRMFE